MRKWATKVFLTLLLLILPLHLSERNVHHQHHYPLSITRSLRIRARLAHAWLHRAPTVRSTRRAEIVGGLFGDVISKVRSYAADGDVGNV